jgi:hypothetical protein
VATIAAISTAQVVGTVAGLVIVLILVGVKPIRERMSKPRRDLR